MSDPEADAPIATAPPTRCERANLASRSKPQARIAQEVLGGWRSTAPARRGAVDAIQSL